METNLILTGASILTPQATPSDTVIISAGKILKVGKKAELTAFFNPNAKILDLKGKTLLPAFIDTHTHFLITGLDLLLTPLFDCSSLGEILERLSDRQKGFGGWLGGIGFDETNFPEQRVPQKKDLDKISRLKPVFIIRRDHHSIVVNSKGLESLNLPLRALKAEEKNGIFRGENNNLVRQKIFGRISKAEKTQALFTASGLALSNGIATLHALEGGGLFLNQDLLLIRELSARLPLNLILYPQVKDPLWVKRELGSARLGGCLLIDGSLGSRTAALFSPYSDCPGNKGMLYFSSRQLFSLVEKAHLMGFQLAFHAIGDRAIAQLTAVYQKVLKLHPKKDHRHRIEHCELPREKEINLLAQMGIYLAVQPAFEILWGKPGGMYQKRLGKRFYSTNPFCRLKNSGLTLGGGSDSDVTPLNALLGIYAAANHPKEKAALSPLEAIKLYTSEAAGFSFDEDKRGEIKAGKAADLVILEQNPLRIKKEKIKEIKVLATLAAGEFRFLAPGFSAPAL